MPFRLRSPELRERREPRFSENIDLPSVGQIVPLFFWISSASVGQAGLARKASNNVGWSGISQVIYIN
jgi:hypothetical protein